MLKTAAEKTTITLDGQSLTCAQVVAVAQSWATPDQATVEIGGEARERIVRSRQAVEALVESGAVVYGVTTGFGSFRDKVIPPDRVAELQHNLIVSHSVGVGDPFDPGTVRALMLIRANTLAKGNSGIRLEVVERLVGMVNRGVYPVIPCKGSVGASGDLAPLAHMVLALIGEGEASYQGERLPGAEAMRRAGLPVTHLDVKEGLALINGTSVMAAIGALGLHEAQLLLKVADIAGALTLEALNGTRDAFDERIHLARPHPNQVASAAYFRALLEGSTFTCSSQDENPGPHPQRVQDAYSLRCMPQVHGAAGEAVAYASRVVERELNAAVDNPLIFWDAEQPVALSGGNFHGEPVALVMDHVKNAVTELGNISERRVARLIDPTLNEGLPAFLVKEGGLNSGFMLPQYTAAALASENKVLVHPASADTIPTSANTEDHVSMGTIAARQAREIIDNVASILAIELIAAAQGLDFRREECESCLGRGTEAAYDLIRERVPFLEKDTIMYPYIEAVREIVAGGELVERVEKAIET